MSAPHGTRFATFVPLLVRFSLAILFSLRCTEIFRDYWDAKKKNGKLFCDRFLTRSSV